MVLQVTQAEPMLFRGDGRPVTDLIRYLEEQMKLWAWKQWRREHEEMGIAAFAVPSLHQNGHLTVSCLEKAQKMTRLYFEESRA